VEFFGSVEGVFNASLTELEAAGLPAQAAQSLGTGRSIELAHDEAAKAAAACVQMMALDDPEYPARLRQIYDPPLVLYVRGNMAALVIPRPMAWAWRSVLVAILHRAGSQLSAAWPAAWTHSPIAVRFRQKAKR
jgi:hypothetical protein